MIEQCRKCGGEMKPGVATQQTWTGTPDFPGEAIVTMSPGGPGRLIACMKCASCGLRSHPLWPATRRPGPATRRG
jgi:hypothetical protein